MSLDSAERAVELSFRSALDALRSYLVRLVKDLKQADGMLTSDALNITRLDGVLRTLRNTADSLGWRKATLTQMQELIGLKDEVLDEAKAKGLSDELTTESQSAVQMLLSGAESELTAIGNQAAEDLGQLLRRSVLAGAPVGDLLTAIESKLEITQAQAITLAHTTQMAFHRALTLRHADDLGVEWFAYVGPDDQVIRDWCSHWVGCRGRIEDFEATAQQWGRDKQPPGVMAWGGGYNCRHRFIPLLSKSDIAEYPIGPS